MLHEGVVLLGSALGEWLEPVGIVGGAHLQRPLLHACSHLVGDAAIQTGTVVDDINEFLIDFGRQVFVHLLTIEYILSEIL